MLNLEGDIVLRPVINQLELEMFTNTPLVQYMNIITKLFIANAVWNS